LWLWDLHIHWIVSSSYCSNVPLFLINNSHLPLVIYHHKEEQTRENCNCTNYSSILSLHWQLLMSLFTEKLYMKWSIFIKTRLISWCDIRFQVINLTCFTPNATFECGVECWRKSISALTSLVMETVVWVFNFWCNAKVYYFWNYACTAT
jgi:hypothetical protein